MAERDCSECIKLDGKFIKALYRRGVARARLTRYNDAIEDFERILTIESDNALAKKEIESIKAKMDKIAQKQKAKEMKTKSQEMLKQQKQQKQQQSKPELSTSTNNSQTKTTTKTPAKNTGGMRRITIEEGSDSDSDSSDETTNKQSQSQLQQQHQQQTKSTTSGTTTKTTKTRIMVSSGTDDNTPESKEMCKDGLCKDKNDKTKDNNVTTVKIEEKGDGNDSNTDVKIQDCNEKEILLKHLKNVVNINNFIEFEKLWNRCDMKNLGVNDIGISLEFQTQILWKIRQRKWKNLFDNMVGDALFNQIIMTIHYIMLKKLCKLCSNVIFNCLIYGDFVLHAYLDCFLLLM